MFSAVFVSINFIFSILMQVKIKKQNNEVLRTYRRTTFYNGSEMEWQWWPKFTETYWSKFWYKIISMRVIEALIISICVCCKWITVDDRSAMDSCKHFILPKGSPKMLQSGNVLCLYCAQKWSPSWSCCLVLWFWLQN